MHLITIADGEAEACHRASEQLRNLFSLLYPICDEPPKFIDLKLVASSKGDAGNARQA